MKAKTVTKAPALLDLGADELRTALTKAKGDVAAFHRKLSECTDAAEQAKLERGLELARKKVAEVEQMVATAAARRTARQLLADCGERQKALVDEEAEGRKILQTCLDALRRAHAAIPWKDKSKHPMGARAHELREEMKWAALDGQVEMPALPVAPDFSKEAGELRSLATDLSAWATHEFVTSEPFTKRGKAERQKQWEASSYAGGNGETVGVMRE